MYLWKLKILLLRKHNNLIVTEKKLTILYYRVSDKCSNFLNNIYILSISFIEV